MSDTARTERGRIGLSRLFEIELCPCSPPAIVFVIDGVRRSLKNPVDLSNKSGRLWVCLAAIVSLWIVFSGAVEARTDQDRAVFRFHLLSEPKSLNPSLLSLTDANYLFGHLFEGLTGVDQMGRIEMRGARLCKWYGSKRLDCRLSSKHQWSTGQRVTAFDYERTIKALIAERKNAAGLDLLRWLQGFEVVLNGSSAAALAKWKGVEAVNHELLRFRFSRPDADFLYKLTSPLLAPVPKLTTWPEPASSDRIPVSGPYQVVEWRVGRWMKLTANPRYCCGATNRPDLEIRFGLDDAAALHLFQSGELDFLRRLSTTMIPQFKGRPEFFQFPVARFDYLGFGPDLTDHPELREALVHSLDFRQLQRLYDARGIPGCVGLDEDLFSQEQGCVRFDLARAKRAFSRWQSKREATADRVFKFMISQLGGEDVRKGAEWIQAQWQSNLGFRVEIVQAEQGQFLSRLRDSPPSVFRKGVGLESPSCTQALMTFHPEGSENFLKIFDRDLLKAIERLQSLGAGSTKAHLSEAKKWCDVGLARLVQTHRLLPLGQIHFTMLASPRFSGWYVNVLNQLDLRRLVATGSTSR